MSALFELLFQFFAWLVGELLLPVLLWLVMFPLALIVSTPFLLIRAAFGPGTYLSKLREGYGSVLRSVRDVPPWDW